MNEERDIVPAASAEPTPYYGRTPEWNPGEQGRADELAGVHDFPVSPRPARGNRAGGGTQIDVGAQVGINRNLEFTAGGRAHRLSTGSHSNNTPSLDPKSGRIHTSTASDTGDPSLGGRDNAGDQPAMPPPVEGVGETIDTSTGDVTPDRMRDRRTV